MLLVGLECHGSRSVSCSFKERQPSIIPLINGLYSLFKNSNETQNFKISRSVHPPKTPSINTPKSLVIFHRSHRSDFLSWETSTLDISKQVPKWLVPSRLPGSRREGRRLGSSWQLRQPGSRLLPPEEWRSHTGSGQGRWLWERSGSTKRARSCWSGSSRSKGWWERSLRTSRPTSASRAALLPLFRRLLRPTLWGSSRTPIFALFTPRELPSCPRISSLPVGLEARGLN